MDVFPIVQTTGSVRKFQPPAELGTVVYMRVQWLSLYVDNPEGNTVEWFATTHTSPDPAILGE